MMSKQAIDAVGFFVMASAGLWSYLDRHATMPARFLPASALLVVGLLLTDALEVRRTGVCVMRNRPDICRDHDAAAFETHLRLLHATVATLLGVSLAVQLCVRFF